MTQGTPNGVRTLAAILLVTGIAGLVALGIVVHRVAGPTAPLGVPTFNPVAQVSPSARATPRATPSLTPRPSAAPTIPFADCSTVTFGPDLAPLNPPADVHVYPAAPPSTIDPAKLYRLTIHTAKGDVAVCLQPTLAPTTVGVIVALARNHFYDGLTFHRVVAGFVVQGGDPKGDGTGDAGFKFMDEPVHQAYGTGVIAMANNGANTNGSQFFICIADGKQCASLGPKYNLFGKVLSGQAVADGLAKGDIMQTVTVAEQA